MWKPGQLVTIDGIVYRVKRNHGGNNVCRQCALDNGYCGWPNRERYPIPGNCYLIRVSP